MQNDDVNEESPLDGGTPLTLTRLANALGCTVGAFYGNKDAETAGIADVVRLWSLLTNEDDRQRVLRLLRERAKNL